MPPETYIVASYLYMQGTDLNIRSHAPIAMIYLIYFKHDIKLMFLQLQAGNINLE